MNRRNSGGGLEAEFNHNVDDSVNYKNQSQKLVEQLEIKLQYLKEKYEAILKNAIVQKVGSRSYWESYMENILTSTIKPMKTFLQQSTHDLPEPWGILLKKMKLTINPSINMDQVINFIIDHENTEKIFDAVYPGSLKGNPVAEMINTFTQKLDLKNKFSQEYQCITKLNEFLQREVKQEIETESDLIKKAYEGLKQEVDGVVLTVETDGAKQNLIKKVYEKYLWKAYGKEAKNNGVYYTPVPVVDYLLKAAAYLLRTEFATDFNSSNVRVLDPFVGTGTFIARLFSADLDLIHPRYVLAKCKNNQIWGNEIMLLPYYIASINISQTINRRLKNKDNFYFKNIVWTDTFQLFKRPVPLFNYDENLNMIAEQQKQNINVIIGNPPYSADENQKHDLLEEEIRKAWAETSDSTRKKVYDSYHKAIMYSIKLLDKKEPGIIAFITNNSYITAKSMDGIRKSFKKLFKKLYIIDLKGSRHGENNKIQGEPIFKGTKIGTALFIGIVKVKQNDNLQSEIFYKSIADNLTQGQKITWLNNHNLESLCVLNNFEKLSCNGHGNWLNDVMKWKPNMQSLSSKINDKLQSKPLFKKFSNGIMFFDKNSTENFSKFKLEKSVKRLIKLFNTYVVDDNPNKEWPFKIKARELQNKAKVLKKSEFFNEKYLHLISVAPFVFKYCYYDPFFPSQHYQFKSIFPLGQNKENILINFGAQPFAFKTLTDLWFLIGKNSARNYPRFCYSINKQTKTLFNNFDNSNLTEQGLHYFDYVEMPSDPKLKADLIFAYIYGFLHYPEYQKHYKNNFLRHDIPRVPKPINWTIFKEISTIGQTLLNLHIYPDQAPYCPQTKFEKGSWGLPDDQYEVVKMKFKKTNNKKDKSTIIFNDYITLINIPLKVYDWILGSKSAVEHVMSGYKRDDDKNSNPNDFAKSKNDPQYILKLLLRVIYISSETLALVQQLPKYNDIEWDQHDITRSNAFIN